MKHPFLQLKLAKQTLAIIKQNKRLLIFPIISNLIGLSIFAIAAIPLYRIEAATAKTNHLDSKTIIIFICILALLFLVMHFFNLLFNAALTQCINKKLQGGEYTLLEGFKALIIFLPTIFLWNNLMTTVGCVVCVIEYWSDNWPKSKIAKKCLSGLTWLTATYFILPVLLFEKHSRIQAVKRSAQLIKKLWGSVLVSQTNMRINTIGMHLLSLLPAIIAFLIGGKIIIIIGSALTVISFIAIFAVNTMIRIILCDALYLFANGNDLSPFYDIELLKNAFKIAQKPSR